MMSSIRVARGSSPALPRQPSQPRLHIPSSSRSWISFWTTLLVGLLCHLAPNLAFAQTDERPPFAITLVDKTAEHPFHGLGSADAYAVDGIVGRHLTLERGVTYVFEMEDVPALHPFYISTSRVGLGQGVHEAGVTGNFATTGQTLRFTPTDETPSLLYYQCSAHDYMGGFIHVVGSETVELVPIADGLIAPVDLAQPDDGTGRLFVVDQIGIIRVIGADGSLLPQPFLDLRDRMTTIRQTFDERGLLGLAFHPDYAMNGRFFVHYSGPLRDEAIQTFDHTTVVSEFLVSSADPNMADHASERIILQVDQPQFNHNGGAVAFGPDGLLYISLGDGGGGGDTGPGHVEDWYEANEGGNAQAVDQNLLGGILRIDVDGADPYAIPDDNPFVGSGGLDEIYAFGLRNPYRISFDLTGSGELLVADAGQDLWEGIYLVESGGNYGWNVREGTYCFDTANRRVVPASCPQDDPDGRPLTPPVIEYPHVRQQDGLGVVVVGGHVYRGDDIPELAGRYIFGDWSSSFTSPGGRVFAVTERHEDARWGFNELLFRGLPDGRLGRYVLGFGRDLAGEVYLLTSQMGSPTGETGAVHRLGADTGVSVVSPVDVPGGISLEQNFPNPFDLTTSIRYHLAQSGDANIAVFDLLGRKIATLADGHAAAGPHTVVWDGTDAGGRPVPNGIYLYRLRHSNHSAASLMVVLR